MANAKPNLAKPAVNVPALPKMPKPKASMKSGLAPLFGQKRQRPVVQSVPTRTPSF